jgi:hypothetical protein
LIAWRDADEPAVAELVQGGIDPPSPEALVDLDAIAMHARSEPTVEGCELRREPMKTPMAPSCTSGVVIVSRRIAS